ncbi:anti-sigma factor [Neomicrococcus lactis]|uniref:anti-sigma factor n=1 Tax=Neomicrococcus lactis TaxID=732241 RepID=UPI002301F925|nr:anti-sigma factor [Neomicrococcus lactis]
MDKNNDELSSDFEPSSLNALSALNALSDAEREQVLRQAEESETARQELDSFQETAALLSLGTTPTQPPARLKANLMNAISGVVQVPAEPTAAAEPEIQTEPEIQAETEIQTKPEARTEPPKNSHQKFFALAASVLLVTAGGLGVVAWNLNEQQQALNERATALATERDGMMQILSAPDMKSKLQTLDDGATVRLSYSVASGMMAVSTTGMPDLPEDKGYELWLISAEGATPAGMLDTSEAEGMKMISGSMSDVTHFGITVEPAGGSDAPTSDPIILQAL